MRAWIVLLLPLIGTAPSLSVAQQSGAYVARISVNSDTQFG